MVALGTMDVVGECVGMPVAAMRKTVLDTFEEDEICDTVRNLREICDALRAEGKKVGGSLMPVFLVSVSTQHNRSASGLHVVACFNSERRSLPLLLYYILILSFLFYSIIFYSFLATLLYCIFYSILLYCCIIFYCILFYATLFHSTVVYSPLFYYFLLYSIVFYSTLLYCIVFYSSVPALSYYCPIQLFYFLLYLFF